jgi:hypothetical protein
MNVEFGSLLWGFCTWLTCRLGPEFASFQKRASADLYPIHTRANSGNWLRACERNRSAIITTFGACACLPEEA